ncbi:MAG: GntR family transcriptional regulator [Clostridiales Family XIII bacterium]|jgi:DNA-binding GntR family transcriptional regulator|nr:GntR family transcriptional regulator [Clostridiales Family XIII bacterium]
MGNRGQTSEQLADAIREEILKETLRPGSKLTEQQISQRFGVSRTPVREAIGGLEAEGLVETIPNRGAFVVGLSATDAADLFEIRKHYEIIAARRAAELATKDDIEKFDESAEFMRYYTGRDDLPRMKQINKDFHETIYKTASSRLLLVSIRRVIIYLNLSVHTKSYRRENLAEILAEHERVYRAIKRRDPDKAAAAMGEHIDNMAKRALKKQ